MKSITEILGGSRILLGISYDIQDLFEDFLTDTYRIFLSLLRVVEEVFPPVEESRAVTGRKAYAIMPFIGAFLAKSFFKLGTNRDLIFRLQSDTSLRKICGFSRIPSEATFSRRFDKLAQNHLMEQAINSLAKKCYHNHIVGHISRDSTAITAREKKTPSPAVCFYFPQSTKSLLPQ